MTSPDRRRPGSVTPERAPVPTQDRQEPREKGIPDLDVEARALCQQLIHGTGEIGKRYLYTSVTQHRRELRSRIDGPLIRGITKYAEQTLPTRIFLRKDNITPHIYHPYRVTNLLLDLLPQLGIPREEWDIWVAAALAHDSVEDPQELRIKINNKKLKADEVRRKKKYARTPEQSRALYDTIMAKEAPHVPKEKTDRVFNTIQILNRYLPNNTKLDPRAYLERVRDEGVGIIKVTDIESAWGDMRRIVREMTESRRGERVLTDDALGALWGQLDGAMLKVGDLLEVLGPHVPEPLKRLMEVTIRAGELFPEEVKKHFAELDKVPQRGVIFQAPSPRRRTSRS